MTVRIDDSTAYEPDTLVYCGPKLPGSALEVRNPVIIVEVRSPSTHRTDALAKLPAYFRLPSVMHYLIVDPDRPMIIHHARGEGEALITRIYHDGTVRLDPPGIEIEVGEVYAA